MNNLTQGNENIKEEIVSKVGLAKKETKQHRKRKILETVEGYLYTLPVILGILIFTAFPAIYAFVSSFFDFKLGVFEFVNFGFQNYIKPFTSGWFLFSKSLLVTFEYALINIPLTLICSFALAVFLNQKIFGIRFFRTLYYLPVLIPAVCSGLVWKNITSIEYGIGNKILMSLGLPASTWFSQVSSAMPSLIFIGFFTIGGGMIMWLAQLKNIPTSLYESAKLDGANYFTSLFSITVPMCTPMIFYNVILSLIGTLQTFTSVQTLTNGSGPKYSLHFYILNIYSAAFTDYELGYAAALSFILLVIIGVLTLIVFKTNKWVYYGEED